MKTIEEIEKEAAECIYVLPPPQIINGVKNWWAVVTEQSGGIVAYFNDEVEADNYCKQLQWNIIWNKLMDTNHNGKRTRQT